MDNSISKHKFRIINWEWNGVPFAINAGGNLMEELQLTQFCDQKLSLEQVFQKISYSTGIPIPQNIEREFFSSGDSLHDLLA